MSMNGIDISHWQDGIDLNKVPFDFCIMKATEGTSFVDNCCDKYYQTVKKKGKLLGVYHFARGLGSGIEEADFFIKNIENYIGEAILVLDFEYTNKPSNKDVQWCKTWLDRVYEKTGVRPLIYMSHSVTRYANWSSVAKEFGLWVARYADMTPTGYLKDPWLGNEGTGAFSVVAIHQYTSVGRLKGYASNLDLDIAYMTKEAWGKYAKGNRRDEKPTTNKTITLKKGESLTIKAE